MTCLFQSEYIDLADNLSEYLVELLNNVRGDRELDIILNAAGGASVDLGSFSKLARLKLALHYEEKKVGYPIVCFCIRTQLSLIVLQDTQHPSGHSPNYSGHPYLSLLIKYNPTTFQ